MLTSSSVVAIRSLGFHLERLIRLASNSDYLGVGVRAKKTIAAAGEHTQIVVCVESLTPRLFLGLFVSRVAESGDSGKSNSVRIGFGPKKTINVPAQNHQLSITRPPAGATLQLSIILCWPT